MEIILNRELGQIFHNMALCYNYLGNEDLFKARAYENASKFLFKFDKDIKDYANDIDKLIELKTIGKSIAENIQEYLTTNQIRKYEALKKQVPIELLDLNDIRGIGENTIKMLNEKVNISGKGGLIKALQQGKLHNFKKFGIKKIQQLERYLKVNKTDKRIQLSKAETYANYFVSQFKNIPGVTAAYIAGSIRRQEASIGDIDMILIVDFQQRNQVNEAIIKMKFDKSVLAQGLTKLSLYINKLNIQLDIRYAEMRELGACLLYLTGPREFTIKMRSIAKNLGYKLNEYGLFNRDGQRVNANTEADIFSKLKMKYKSPRERSLDYVNPVLA